MPKHKENFNDFNKVITALKEEKTQAEVTHIFKISQQFVSVWNKVFSTRKTVQSKPRSDRPKKPLP